MNYIVYSSSTRLSLRDRVSPLTKWLNNVEDFDRHSPFPQGSGVSSDKMVEQCRGFRTALAFPLGIEYIYQLDGRTMSRISLRLGPAEIVY